MARRRRNSYPVNGQYNYGSTAPAYLPEIPEIPEEIKKNRSVPTEREQKPAPKVQKRKVTKLGFVAEERNYFAGKRLFRNLAFFAVLFLVFSAIITRYSIISSKNLENQKLEANIDSKKTKIELLTVSLNEARDLVVLQKRAEELGLGFADEAQVRYITVKVPAEESRDEFDESFDMLEIPEYFKSLFG